MELTSKQVFKQTDVGVIPKDWDLKTIHALCNVMGRVGWKGYTKKDLIPNGPYAIGAKHINKNNKIDLSEPTCISWEKYYESPEIYVFKDDLLIVQRGTIGKLVIIDKEIGEATINPSMLIIRSKFENSRFIYYYLLSRSGQNQILLDTSSTGVPMITQKQVKEFKIPLPPTIEEQKSIATALTDVDELISGLEKLISKKKDIKQGAMQQLLTPKESWKKTCLIELADNKKSQFDDGDWVESEYIISQGVRLVQTGNIGIGQFKDKGNKKYISEDSFNKLNCKEVLEGDLLVCRLAEPAGRACIMPNIGEYKVITSVDVSIFRGNPKIVNREFLSQLFTTNNWFQKVIEKVGGTTHKRISRGALGKIEIEIPLIEEQQAITQILSDMDTEITQLETKKEKYQSIKQGMMQELLTGKTRLL